MHLAKKMFNIAVKKSIHFFFAPVESIRYDTFRLAIGCSLLVYISFRFQYAGEWLTAEGFHVSAQNLPFDTLTMPLLSKTLLPWFGLLFFGAILLLIFGVQIHLSSLICLLCLVYSTGVDQLSAFSVNKTLTFSLLLFCLSPHGSHWSLGKSSSSLVPAWPLRIVQITMIVFLFCAGWIKAVHGEWFQNPLVLYTQIQGTYRTDFAAWMINVLPLKAWTWMQFSGVMFELLVPILFIFKSLRPIGLLWAFCFHVMMALTIHHLIYFILVVACFYLVFVDEKILQRVENRIKKTVGKI